MEKITTVHSITRVRARKERTKRIGKYRGFLEPTLTIERDRPEEMWASQYSINLKNKRNGTVVFRKRVSLDNHASASLREKLTDHQETLRKMVPSVIAEYLKGRKKTTGFYVEPTSIFKEDDDVIWEPTV